MPGSCVNDRRRVGDYFSVVPSRVSGLVLGVLGVALAIAQSCHSDDTGANSGAERGMFDGGVDASPVSGGTGGVGGRTGAAGGAAGTNTGAGGASGGAAGAAGASNGSGAGVGAGGSSAAGTGSAAGGASGLNDGAAGTADVSAGGAGAAGANDGGGGSAGASGGGSGTAGASDGGVERQARAAQTAVHVGRLGGTARCDRMRSNHLLPARVPTAARGSTGFAHRMRGARKPAPPLRRYFATDREIAPSERSADSPIRTPRSAARRRPVCSTR